MIKEDIIAKNIGRIYLVIPFLKDLKIGEIINQVVQDQGDIDIGRVLEILILNRACGFNTPLYKISQWAKDHAVDEIYGCKWSKLNDDRIGDCLDKVVEKLPDLDSLITINMLKSFNLNQSQIHFDPSSFTIIGQPISNAGDPKTIEAKYGRGSSGSKSQRQIRFGIAITGGEAVPLFGKAYSGNTSDYQMHPEFLEQLRDVAEINDFLFISDSKFDSQNNLKNIFTHEGKFLCTGAFSKKEKENYLLALEQTIDWQILTYLSKEDKKKPKNKRPIYKAFEQERILKCKFNGEIKEYTYRLIFVHSSQNARQEKHTREKYFNKITQELDAVQSRLNKDKYRDKQYVKKKINDILHLHPVGKFFDCKLRRYKGRLIFNYSIDQQKLKELEAFDGIYIMKTNLDADSYSLNDVIKTYKQQIQIEHRMKVVKSFLKVAPCGLKLPKRIASMFFIITQALKIYSLIESETRKSLKKQNKEIYILPESRKTATPTAETIFKAFDYGIFILYFQHKDLCKKCLTSLNYLQKEVFSLLGIAIMNLKNLSRKFGLLRSSPA